MSALEPEQIIGTWFHGFLDRYEWDEFCVDERHGLLDALAAAGYHVVRTMETVTEDGERVRLEKSGRTYRVVRERRGDHIYYDVLPFYRATEVES